MPLSSNAVIRSALTCLQVPFTLFCQFPKHDKEETLCPLKPSTPILASWGLRFGRQGRFGRQRGNWAYEESGAVSGQFPVETLHWYGRNSSLFGLDVRKNLDILHDS